MTKMIYRFNGKPMGEARKNAGWTQDEAASELGISKRQYCRWEYGEVRLKDYQISKLKEMFCNE